jgi:hypothetical protein
MPIEGGGIPMATGDAAASAPISMDSWRDVVPMGVGEEGGARERRVAIDEIDFSIV